MTRIVVKNAAQAMQHFFNQTPGAEYVFHTGRKFAGREARANGALAGCIMDGIGGPVLLIPLDKPHHVGKYPDLLAAASPYPVVRAPLCFSDSICGYLPLTVDKLVSRFETALYNALFEAAASWSTRRERVRFAAVFEAARAFSEHLRPIDELWTYGPAAARFSARAK